jgi:hypothetical protein
VLPSFGSAAWDLVVARVAGLGRESHDRPAGDDLALGPSRLVRDFGDIDYVVAGEVGGPRSPVRSAI